MLFEPLGKFDQCVGKTNRMLQRQQMAYVRPFEMFGLPQLLAELLYMILIEKESVLKTCDCQDGQI
jgi:hypothetical protein